MFHKEIYLNITWRLLKNSWYYTDIGKEKKI